MTIHVNGESRLIATDTSVGGLVDEVVPRGRSGVAVAVNGVVVRRSVWDGTPLASEDRVEVLVAVQGG